MDDDLTYSVGALDVLAEFHEIKYVIYVEGVNDKLFWELILEKTGIKDFEMKPAGGREEVNKYISQIIENDALIIAIRDKDYEEEKGILKYHDRVIYTEGYSHENSMFSESIVNKIIAIKSKTNQIDRQRYSAWRDQQFEKIRDLLALEIAFELEQSGRAVLGQNYKALIRRGSQAEVCASIIKKLYLEKTVGFDEEVVNQVKNNLSGKQVYKIIRGHLYMRAVAEFIICQVDQYYPRKSKISLSSDDLREMTIAILQANNIHIDDYVIVKQKIHAAINSLDAAI